MCGEEFEQLKTNIEMSSIKPLDLLVLKFHMEHDLTPGSQKFVKSGQF